MGSSLGYFIVLTEVVALVIAVLWYIKQPNQSHFILLFLLSMIICNEGASLFHGYQKVSWLKNNAMLMFNTTLLLEVILYLILITSLMLDKGRQRRMVFILLLYILLIVLFLLFIEQPHQRFTILSFCIGSILTVLFILVYFYEQITQGSIASGNRNFWNWILSFLMFFLAVEIPFMCVFNYALSHPDFFKSHSWLANFKVASSCIYYLSYIFGFVWANRK